eukprot:5636733-Pyramimonas_sp.AAC.2
MESRYVSLSRRSCPAGIVLVTAGNQWRTSMAAARSTEHDGDRSNYISPRHSRSCTYVELAWETPSRLTEAFV